MKKILILSIVAGIALSGYALWNQSERVGATILFPSGGGTGKGSAAAGDVGKYLKVSDDSPFTYTFDTPGGASSGFIVNATGTPSQLAAFSGVNSLISTSTINVSSLNATSTTLASVLNLLLMTSGTSTSFTVSDSPSAILYTNASGSIKPYAGTSCTNQFVRSLSAVGAATCATVGTADVAGLDISDDTNLAVSYPIVLTGDTLSFGYTYPLPNSATSTLITFSGGLNASGGTATFGTLAGAIDAGGATSFEIVNGTGPTVDAAGEIAVDTTSDQLIYYGGAKRVVSYEKDLGFAYATSTWAGTTTVRIGPAVNAITVNHAYCETDTGTVDVSLYDGTNRATFLKGASTTIGRMKYGTNNTFTAGESIRVDLGNPASTPKTLSCRFVYTYTAD